MTGTGIPLTISWGAVVFRLEGFGAAPEALGALCAYLGACAARDRDGAGPPPAADDATLAGLVGPEIARRITVEAREGTVALRLRDAGAAEAPARVRVVRAPRAEVEAACAAARPGTDAAPSEGSLSAEDEAALQRELDRAEGERDPPSPPREAAPPETARIFARVDSRMSGTGLRQRHGAHRHLRAALAANRADRAAGRAAGAGADDGPYRHDLAAARGDDMSGPLRLEPSQRVDTAGPGDAGFRAFCSEMGAATLPERLEAAAAWLADVEGRASFPRAALLEMLCEADGEAPALDAALRACAQLLRAGRLEARPGGALAPTGTTRFRTAARRCDRSGTL